MIDLARYPVHDPGARRALIADGQRALAAEGCISLPGFVSAEIAAAMAAEAAIACTAFGHRRDLRLGPYHDLPAASLPLDHPARRAHPYRMQVLAMDRLPEAGWIRRLYEDDALTLLVRDLLGEPELYRCADPLVSCVTTHLGPGDQHGWHFDANDFVVSLLLQQPEEGGAFEFAPWLRDDAAENYDDAAAVMDGTWPGLRRLPAAPGTLIIFQGKRALHRVTPVAGSRSRIIALFSYDRRPGMIFPERVRLSAVGRAWPGDPPAAKA